MKSIKSLVYLSMFTIANFEATMPSIVNKKCTNFNRRSQNVFIKTRRKTETLWMINEANNSGSNFHISPTNMYWIIVVYYLEYFRGIFLTKKVLLFLWFLLTNNACFKYLTVFVGAICLIHHTKIASTVIQSKYYRLSYAHPLQCFLKTCSYYVLVRYHFYVSKVCYVVLIYNIFHLLRLKLTIWHEATLVIKL